MTHIRERLRTTRNLLAALGFAATLTACQSPAVFEVHRVALDSIPPAYAAANERQLGAWRLADAAHRAQMRVLARNTQTGGDARELHVESLAARAVHTIATNPDGPAQPVSSSERSLLAAR